MIDPNTLTKEQRLDVLVIKYKFIDTSVEGIMKAIPGAIKTPDAFYTLLINKSPDGMLWSASYSLIVSDIIDGHASADVTQDIIWSRGTDIQSVLAALYILVKEKTLA